MKRPYGYTDRTMMQLWRRAVLAHWRYRDPISGHYSPGGSGLECHHVVKRRHWLLRYDWRNGIPMTPETHREVEMGRHRARIAELTDSEYLDLRAGMRKHDYMTAEGLSEAEVLELMKTDLLRKIEEEA